MNSIYNIIQCILYHECSVTEVCLEPYGSSVSMMPDAYLRVPVCAACMARAHQALRWPSLSLEVKKRTPNCSRLIFATTGKVLLETKKMKGGPSEAYLKASANYEVFRFLNEELSLTSLELLTATKSPNGRTVPT